MSIETTGGEDRVMTFATPDKPFTVHATIGVYAKEPDITRLKDMSVRIAYATSDEMLANTDEDMGAAIVLAVRGLQSAGVTVPSDLVASPVAMAAAMEQDA